MKPQRAPAEGPAGYESRDARVAWIFAFILFLALAGVCVHFGLSAMLAHLQKKPAPTDAWHPAANVAAAPQPRPALPPLQISPPADLEKFRAREDSELNSYGWVNHTSGIVRIPITRAMDLLLEKGLPSTSNATGPSNLELQQQRPLHTAPEIQRNP